MAPSQVAARQTRSSTPGASKTKVQERPMNENALQNSPIRGKDVRKSVLTKGQDALKPAAPKATGRTWRTAVALLAVLGLLGAGVAVTPQFNPELSKKFFGNATLASVRDAAVDFQHSVGTYGTNMSLAMAGNIRNAVLNFDLHGHVESASNMTHDVQQAIAKFDWAHYMALAHSFDYMEFARSLDVKGYKPQCEFIADSWVVKCAPGALVAPVAVVVTSLALVIFLSRKRSAKKAAK